MTFSLEEDVNYGSTTDTTTTHSHSRGRGDEGDLQDEDDEDEMDNIRRKQGTPRVNLQRATSGDELLLPLDGEGSIDHASYSETEEQEVADYSEVSFGLSTPRRWLEPGRKLTTVWWLWGFTGGASDDDGQRVVSVDAQEGIDRAAAHAPAAVLPHHGPPAGHQYVLSPRPRN
jgi:hypothetical protein